MACRFQKEPKKDLRPGIPYATLDSTAPPVTQGATPAEGGELAGISFGLWKGLPHARRDHHQ